MNYFKVKKLNSDGYVTLVTPDNLYETEIPLRSTKVMYESGSIFLENPEKIYESHL